MTVDVSYQGLPLVKGAPARDEDGALFVELDMPMPVGARLDVTTPDGTTKSGRVFTVVEGVGAGMVVAFGAYTPKARPIPPAPKPSEPNAPMAEMKSAPPVPLDEAAPAPAAAESGKEEGDDGPLDDPKKKGGRRSKARKTVIGH